MPKKNKTEVKIPSKAAVAASSKPIAKKSVKDSREKPDKVCLKEKLTQNNKFRRLSFDVQEDGDNFPSSQSEYHQRLIDQKKEIYKNPPQMPFLGIEAFTKRQPLPKREYNNDLVFDDHSEFRPNTSPGEVLQAGAFGGTYFRSITSAVTNKTYKSSEVLADTVLEEWISGLNKGNQLTSSIYRNNVNKYGVKCGGSLGMWESSGWMSNLDPYGWFQWYCRFYQGRRSDDDVRQISRFNKSAGPTGRFRTQLANKCISANTHANDASISPVIRQTLLHWGFQLTPEQLVKHTKKALKK